MTAQQSRATGRADKRAALVEQRREQILVAAARIMSMTGFHGMSMQAVAEEAGISVGLIYQYFGGKGELLEAVIVDILDSFRAEVPRAMAAAPNDPAGRLSAGFAAYCKVIDAHHDAARLTYRESPTLDSDGRARIMALEQETTAPLEEAITAGIEQGLFRPVRADLVAHNLKMSAHAWALKYWDLSQRVTLDEYVEAELDFILAGLRPV